MRPAVRLLALATLATAVTAVAPFAPGGAIHPVSAAPGDQLWLSFDQGESLAPGTPASDASGTGNHGTVRSGFGGVIEPTPWGVADFPGRCWNEPCPNAMIDIPDSPTLDPGTAAFEWGASIRLRPDETADGMNVVQKGLYGDSGGQWKLQVDKAGGFPSCVLSGRRNGATLRVMVKSSVGIADDAWHQVTCRRNSSGVQIIVDGTVRGSAKMAVVNLASGAPVTVGAKNVSARDNDQFQGRLDDVFMRLI